MGAAANLILVADKARLVGINHVVLEVDDVDDALDFYGRIFDFELRGRAGHMAFLDMGDQFLVLAASASASWPSRQAPSCTAGAGSTLATPGATTCRSSSTRTSSSPRPRQCWPA